MLFSDITLLYNSQDQKLHTLSVSQTENILDEVLLGSLNRTSSGENEEKTEAMRCYGQVHTVGLFLRPMNQSEMT